MPWHEKKCPVWVAGLASVAAFPNMCALSKSKRRKILTFQQLRCKAKDILLPYPFVFLDGPITRVVCLEMVMESDNESGSPA